MTFEAYLEQYYANWADSKFTPRRSLMTSSERISPSGRISRSGDAVTAIHVHSRDCASGVIRAAAGESLLAKLHRNPHEHASP
jgi:hypothetical protein